jgi:hypothetical protein
MGVQRRKKRLQWTPEQLAPLIGNKTDSMRHWCAHLDSILFGGVENVKVTLRDRGVDEDILENLPCLVEWARYIQWHNNADQMLRQNNIPTMVMYYEQYTYNFDALVNQEFDFLGLKKVKEPLPFIPGKTYERYYDKETARRAARLVKALATPGCFRLIKHYVSKWLDIIEEKDVPNVSTKDRSIVSNPAETRIVLLMSFPNSGTSYTLLNMMAVTNISAATNYEQEVDYGLSVPVRPDFTASPFWLMPTGPRPRLVLTKTHCNPSSDFLNFQDGCRQVRPTNGGKSAYSLYPFDVVAKAIHIVRNPFDNIVARM